MSVLVKDPSDRSVCWGMMSPGMVSDTKAVQTNFTVTLQHFWQGMTMRGIRHHVNFYSKCPTWLHTRIWHITGTLLHASLPADCKICFYLIIPSNKSVSVSLISMGASVQLLLFSCVMHGCLIALLGCLCHGRLLLSWGFYLHILQIQWRLLALLIQLGAKHTLWN